MAAQSKEPVEHAWLYIATITSSKWGPEWVYGRRLAKAIVPDPVKYPEIEAMLELKAVREKDGRIRAIPFHINPQGGVAADSKDYRRFEPRASMIREKWTCAEIEGYLYGEPEAGRDRYTWEEYRECRPWDTGMTMEDVGKHCENDTAKFIAQRETENHHKRGTKRGPGERLQLRFR